MEPEVVRSEFVTGWAVRDQGASTTSVFLNTDWLKVRGVAARFFETEMIDDKRLRNWADKRLVGDPVRFLIFGRYVKLPVSVRATIGQP
jgi:hypothetical protein